MSWKYDGRIRRRAANAYVDSTGGTKKPICPKCYDTGINIDLVPYVNDAGIRDDNYRRCQNCSDIIPVKEMKYETELEDFVDVESAKKPSEFIVVEKRRKVRTSSNRYEEEPFKVPELAGRPDTELENLLRDRPGIVTALVDSDIDEEQEEDN